MGRCGYSGDESLLNSYNYSNFRSVKRAITDLLRLYEKASLGGNNGALIIMTDMKRALIDSNVLTHREREAIYYCLVLGYKESEVADILCITQQAVHYLIKSGIKRIIRFLLTGKSSNSKFTKQDIERIIELYSKGVKPKEIADILNKSVKSVRNKVKALKKGGKITAG